ncbi:MAG: 50S ribosomal protein L6 [Pseudomonadota bacterium]
MSRIGKKPIPIPKDVIIDQKGDILTVKGPKGELELKMNPMVRMDREQDIIVLSVEDGNKASKALHGLFRSHIANMVMGVTKGFERILEIVGVGYKAELSGKTAIFHLGYSHPINFPLPEGIEAKIEKTRIILSGIDKALLGETAAKIRRLREPETYKGKGIRYTDEIIKKKAGKSGAK